MGQASRMPIALPVPTSAGYSSEKHAELPIIQSSNLDLVTSSTRSPQILRGQLLDHSYRTRIVMIFALFALLIAFVFFVCSLILLNYGRHLGMRYLTKDQGIMTGLSTVEGAVFALIGL